MAAARSSQLHTSSTQSESPLLGLPAEIRNEILRMVLVHHEPVSVGSTKQPHHGHSAGWPDIADTCKQLREEALPVFFGNNTFSIKWDATSQSLRHADPWLRRLEAAPLSIKRLIDSLEVNIAQGMMVAETIEPWTDKTHRPLFRRCSTFLSYLSNAGLEAHQLAWPGVYHHGFTDLLMWGPGNISGSEDWDVWVGARLFNAFVLSPLLREHGLYDDSRPPVDVVRHFQAESEGTELEGYAGFLSDSWNSWKDCEPGDWYWAWVAEEEETLWREEESNE